MAKTATGKARSYDPAKVRAALAAQTEALRAAVHRLCGDPAAAALLERPTRLGQWRVRQLVAHLALQLAWLPNNLDQSPQGRRPLGLTAWVAEVGSLAELLDAGTQAHAAEDFAGGPAAVAAGFDAAADALLALLDGAEVRDPQRRFEIRLGSMTLADLLVTRLVEAVVHADDLAAALELPAFPHDRFALASVCRLLADAFAAQQPGGAVELRIPPFAVVQAVPGPRHTRGTPPNVVESDPLTWVRLATGRQAWAAALDAAQVSASGERSDLAAFLPVMA
ncbi:sterol carrier family protein [Kitasatospora sp. NBC_01287]|uniref:sterol carrier family protein n=1 Tax=Kitasatospora sp. NBC_01287 TaxID=2903573 RepID=UPI00225051B3|nr:sterol carrier family protein [Kitasatospora sp. NBC_01287]MCX4747585.1 sterol carrier family protein [Kitasatospora sp. NBC_01287]